MPELDDMSLLRRYAGGDEAAFTALYERYVHLVYSAALRQVRNPSHAEEITQVVFILLAQKAKSLGSKTVLSGWLYQAARLTTANLIKREMRRQRREQEVYMQTLTGPDPALWEQISPWLDEAMARLGEQDRDAIVLRYFENRSSEAVAARLNLSEVAARKRVSRALEKLRTFFEKRGVVLSAEVIAGTIADHSVHAAPVGLASPAVALAIAKGAGVSASTLILTKGALKIMAWTKIKTAVAVTATAIVLGVGGTVAATKLAHIIRVARYPNIAGVWEGNVRLGEPGVGRDQESQGHFVLKLFKNFGSYSATTDWPEWGKKDVPTVDVVYEYPNLVIHPTARDTWTFKVNAGATALDWDRHLNFVEADPVKLGHTATPTPVPAPLAESDFAPEIRATLQGYWEGSIGIGTNAVQVNLKINRLEDGTYRAEGDIPLQGVQGRPVDMTYQPPAVEFRPADGAGMFQGQVNQANTEISGTWTQGGVTLPASIRRVDYGAKHEQDAGREYFHISADDLQGHWRGTWTVEFNGGKTKVPIREALDIAKLPGGTYFATVANVDEFGKDAPVPASAFKFSSPKVHLEWKSQGGGFDGKIINGKIVGKWEQGVGGFPIVFERER